mmetsp:Transcript_36025/g.26764  ORF Transcript_36025/g.26764 Transcript_36025/m.26764 type:complete len:101 (+) Transcript_36025:104-406(+)
MSVTGAFLGGLASLSFPFFLNAILHRRYFKSPWIHVVSVAAGSYIGYNITRWQEDLVHGANAERKALGLPPLPIVSAYDIGLAGRLILESDPETKEQNKN